MSEIIWYGTLLGLFVGTMHFVQMLVSQLGQTGTDAPAVLWRAVCTLVLWTVFGAYVLILFVLGAVLYLIFARAGTVGGAS